MKMTSWMFLVLTCALVFEGATSGEGRLFISDIAVPGIVINIDK